MYAAGLRRDDVVDMALTAGLKREPLAVGSSPDPHLEGCEETLVASVPCLLRLSFPIRSRRATSAAPPFRAAGQAHDAPHLTA